MRSSSCHSKKTKCNILKTNRNMKKKRYYDMFDLIEDNSPLASLFNRILKQLDVVRIISAPSTFERMEETKEQNFKLFYETCLWEMYLHGVIDKLNHWGEVLDEYINEFGASWKYYASAKRLESIKEYGGEDSDYDSKGKVRTEGLTNKDLECDTVIRHLVQDDWQDIVQETTLDHLNGLVLALQAQAKVSVRGIFKHLYGQEIPLYKQDENGNMVKMNFADESLMKASDELRADDYSSLVLSVCFGVQQIIRKIRELDPFSDNKEELARVRKDAETMLNLRFLVHQ